jgi:DNA polymerase I
MPHTLLLVDGSNAAFRAFFGIQTDMRAADGFPTRALFGFISMLRKLKADHKPDGLVVVFDRGLSFRNALYPDYKGQRPDMPDDLRMQWPEFLPLSRELGHTALAQEGFEADDIIGTLAARFAGPDCDVVIVSSDKDFAQLVNPYVSLLDLKTGERVGREGVIERWGVPPERIIDLLALMGDTSDNVPGAVGVGPKKAAKYIETYGTVEDVVANATKIGGKTGEAIAAHGAQLNLCRELVTIHLEVPVEGVTGFADLLDSEPLYEPLAARLSHYGFRSMLADVRSQAGTEVGPQSKASGATYRAVTTPAELEALVADLRAAGRFAYDSETTSLKPRDAQIVGMSFCWADDQAIYVPIAHVDGPNCEGALEALLPLLADPNLRKTGQNLKYDLEVLRARGADLQGIDGDTMLADFLVDVDRKHNLDAMALRYLDHTMISFADTAGKVDNQFARVQVAEATRYAAEDAHIAWLIDHTIELPGPLGELYRTIDLPLIPVLAEMELHGIAVDLPALAELGVELGQRIEGMVAGIYAEAGEEFNVNSTKQLAELLFEKRGLTPVKKTQSGFSTDADTLSQLADQGDALCRLILGYRELNKLKSTYVDALPGFADDDGRIRTSYHQAVAATGRLSSNDPNLQNIPVRTDEGRRIRRCFVAPPGRTFVSADYSQVELRVLAHFCGEGPLVEAFREGQDIHRRTAAEIFGVALALVSGEQRRAAKAINFGIVYGMSAFRLANDLRIDRREAQRYINSYFQRYPQVKTYMDDAVRLAREKGYAETLHGRRRAVANLDARNPVERGAAERIAINSPVQGTAADLIKIAMIRVHKRLRRDFPDARLLLQVHDELFLEVADHEVEAVRAAVAEEMEGAAALVVPLVADTGVGRSWDEAH